VAFLLILLLASSHKLSVHDTFKHKAGEKSQHLHHHSISGTDSRSTIDKTVSSNSNINTGNKTDKIIILTFGDMKKSQGKLNYANTYSVREWNHNALDRVLLHNDTIIFQRFIKEVNSGINFNNKKGLVDAIPVIAYHIVDNSLNPSSSDTNLFATEMKYLHDVIPMSDLRYNQTNNLISINR
jgi:hypothetical protein